MKTYLKYRVFVNANNPQNKQITICVETGEVIMEVPFTEMIALAMECYTKKEFQKKL